MKILRTEQEIMDLILSVAKSDERIRAVLLVGSRANPAIPKDSYQLPALLIRLRRQWMELE